eukprot:8011908-Lingulodinium_polyedra.AAC.1
MAPRNGGAFNTAKAASSEMPRPPPWKRAPAAHLTTLKLGRAGARRNALGEPRPGAREVEQPHPQTRGGDALLRAHVD